MNETFFCAISGSFKFKDKIDLVIRQFQSLGVRVLAPDLGWSYTPYPYFQFRSSTSGFRPLPSEINLSIKQVENNFLLAVKHSNFLYLVNPHGYFGDSSALELGFAYAHGRRIFSLEPPSQFLDLHPEYRHLITVLSPEEVAAIYRTPKQPH